MPPGPCLLVANHSGALPFDGPMLHAGAAPRAPGPPRGALARRGPGLPRAVPRHAPQPPRRGARLPGERGAPARRRRARSSSSPRASRASASSTASATSCSASAAAASSSSRCAPARPSSRWRSSAPRRSMPLLGAAAAGQTARPPVPPDHPDLPVPGPLACPPDQWCIRFGEPLSTREHGAGAADDPACSSSRSTEHARVERSRDARRRSSSEREVDLRPARRPSRPYAVRADAVAPGALRLVELLVRRA